jgi:hypothetical protein
MRWRVRTGASGPQLDAYWSPMRNRAPAKCTVTPHNIMLRLFRKVTTGCLRAGAGMFPPPQIRHQSTNCLGGLRFQKSRRFSCCRLASTGAHVRPVRYGVVFVNGFETTPGPAPSATTGQGPASKVPRIGPLRRNGRRADADRMHREAVPCFGSKNGCNPRNDCSRQGEPSR